MTHIDLTKPVEVPSWLKIAARPTSIGSGELERQWQEIGEETTEAILKVLPTGKYTMGPYLKIFEDEFAKYSECKYGIGISSGTAALHLAMRAIEVGPGEEVITSPTPMWQQPLRLPIPARRQCLWTLTPGLTT